MSEGMLKCDDCKWYVYLPSIANNNIKYSTLFPYTAVDTRVCALGCCKDYSRFENKENKNDNC